MFDSDNLNESKKRIRKDAVFFRNKQLTLILIVANQFKE